MKRLLTSLVLLLAATPALAGTVNYNPPFGYWRMPVDKIGVESPNVDGLAFDPSVDKASDVLAALDKARAAHVKLFIQLVQFADLKENPPGNFQLSQWQARYDAWCPQGQCIALKPYVDDGTLMGIHIFEYSKPPIPQRLTPDLGQIAQVAAYVRSKWPGVPIIMDTSKPCLFLDPKRQMAGKLDILIYTFFTNELTDTRRGEGMVNNGVACAKQAGVKFMLDPNPFGGTQGGLAPGALDRYVHFTEFSIRYPGSMATAIWRWWPGDSPSKGNGFQHFANFYSEQSNPGVTKAMSEIAACAANPATACPHG
ncbi:MAG TPA: hypothetical protein VMH86_14590 [Rhizomicrobium sp.]|nr:hypothetical protein [Rhizomicrobium sp.]